MTYKHLLAEIRERLGEAFADGNHQAARAVFLEMLQVGKAWLLELREWPTHSEANQAQRFTEALEALEQTLRRNDEIVTFAPFLIGERVEAEQIQYGPRMCGLRLRYSTVGRLSRGLVSTRTREPWTTSSRIAMEKRAGVRTLG